MKHFFLTITITLLALTLQAQNVDSLYSAFCTSQGQKHIAIANEFYQTLCNMQYIDYVNTYTSQNDNREMDADVHGEMAVFLYEEGRYQDATEATKKTIALAMQLGDSVLLTDNYSLLGICYQRMGYYDNALECSNKCMEIETALNDNERLGSSYNTLAGLYLQNERLDMALIYCQKSIDLARQLNDDRNLAIRLGTQCDIFLKADSTEQALTSITEALELDSTAGRIEKMAIRLSQKGDVLYAMQRWSAAEKCCTEALAVFERYDRKTSRAICLRQLGAINKMQGKRDKAEYYTLKSLEVSQAIGNRFLEQKTYKQLSDLNRNNNPVKALEYYDQYVELKDSIFSERTQKQLNDFEVKYNTREKEHQIVLQEARIKRQKIWTFAIIGIAILFLALAVLTFYYLRLTKRHNEELTEINDIKNKFFSIISHDLKNPVLAQKRVLGNLSKNISAMSAEDTKLTIDLLLDSVTMQSDLLQNLLVWAQMQTGRMPYTPIYFNVNSMLAQIASLAKLQTDNKKLTINIISSDDCTCYADKNMITTIVRNLLSNAIKFTQEGGNITLQAESADKQCVIKVIDSGLGMSDETQKKLFRLDTHHTTTGTHNEQGTGLGLIICKDMVQKNGGTISVNSILGKGSAFIITLASKPQ